MTEYPYLYIYTVIGYKEENPSQTFNDVTSINVYADSEKEALEKAKKVMSKPFYRISAVREEIDSTKAQYLLAKEQMGIQKDLVDVFKNDWEK